MIRLYGEGGPFTFGGRNGWQEDNGFVYSYNGGSGYTSGNTLYNKTFPNHGTI